MSDYQYSLKDLAEFELENCCESVCDKYHVINYITDLEKKVEQLEQEIDNLKGK